MVILYLTLFAVIYFIPSIVANSNNKKNEGAIIVFNILLGWTILGWVIALVWAMMKD